MGAELPKTIGRYQILDLIGEGGMGTVYKALQPSLNRTVAIKTLPPKMVAQPELTARFGRETQALARLNHPNIVNIIDSGMDGEAPFFVMEYVDGCSLAELTAERTLSLSDGLRVIREVGSGLDYAHRMGVIHRDLKLSNILVTRDLATIKIADFGISRLDDDGRSPQLTTTRTGLGTMYYMAPEQAADASSVDKRTDVYSLGVVCYQLLTGQIPAGRFSMPSQLNPHLPPELDPIVLRCLAFNRDERYDHIADVLTDLDHVKQLAGFRLMESLKVLSQSTSHALKTSTSRMARQRPMAMVAGAAALVLIVGGGAYALWPARHATPTAPAVTPTAAPTPTPMAATAAPPAAPVAEPTATPTPATPPPVVAAPASAPVTTPVTSPAPTPAAPKVEASPVKSAKPSKAAAEAQHALELMRAKIDGGLAPQTLGELQQFVAAQRATPLGFDGLLLLGDLNDKLGRTDQAVQSYQDAAKTFAADPRAGQALFKAAQVQARQRHRKDAIASYALVLDKYPKSPWAIPSMLAKADLEEKEDIKVVDPQSGSRMPAAILTYRAFVAANPSRPETEHALWQLGALYADIDRYVDAAATYVQLVTKFPQTRLDAAFQAGEWYEKKVKDAAKAIVAYRLVPPQSENAKKAADRIAKLSK